jgi:hypothetical protein
MLKTAAALAIVSAIAGTGYLFARPSTDPARSQPSSDSVSSVTRTGRETALPTLPAPMPPTQRNLVDTAPAQAGAVSGSGTTLDCLSVARHMIDLAAQAQPDLIGHASPDRIAAHLKPGVDHFEHECSTQHWSQPYLACLAGATDVFTLRVGCMKLAPADRDRPTAIGSDGSQVVLENSVPHPPYVGNDLSCNSVSKHVETLSQPDPASLAKLSPAMQKGIASAQASVADQTEAACDQGGWSETVRRCMLHATTTEALAGCL